MDGWLDGWMDGWIDGWMDDDDVSRAYNDSDHGGCGLMVDGYHRCKPCDAPGKRH